MYIQTITYAPISTSGLDLVYDGSYDDDNFFIELPTPFDINFLNINYTSVYVSSNPFITFGGGSSSCCFNIPNEIPSDVSLPGVFLSFSCPNQISDYDGQMFQLYTGLTDGGNTMVIKYIGSDHCDEIASLVYGFKFYKDNSDYFDLVIEENTSFFNNDPTGGISDGINVDWLNTFDSSPLNSYRAFNNEPNPSRSANTETIICQEVCTGSGTTISTQIIPPHPVWTDGYGTQVTQLNMVTLGGPNGLNS